MRYICTAVVATLALVGTSFADTINVPGDQPTIAAAISASSDGDVIAIAAGTYYEHSLSTGGKAITIGSASGNLDVTIDANGGGSVFVIDSGEGSGTVIKDLVITGGYNYYGGGIYCENSSPTISGCTISNNTAAWAGEGGGIYCLYSSPTISGCTISGNEASNNGGGIFCELSNPTISGCTIEGNTGHYGGGIYCNGSSPTITDCTIEGNTAGYGGGISCYYYSDPTISGCTISGNTAYFGGGIRSNSDPTISDSIICSNEPEQLNGTWNSGGGNDIATNCPVALPPTGACCVSSGCVRISNDDCAALGGTWLGEGGSCDDCVPAEPTGACCVSSGCVANSNDDCTALGGTWLGEDASCDDCPASCMGDTDGNGVVNIEDLLNMLGSWGACP